MHGALARMTRIGGGLTRAVWCLLLSLAATGMAAAQTGEREIEAAALYMPKLGAQPGQRLKTRTAISCFRQAANDYRCIILGLRMQGAMVIAPSIDAAAKTYLERYCRGRRSGLDYPECRFRVAFDYVSESFDEGESLRIYRAENLVLDSEYLRFERTPPIRGEAVPAVEDKRSTGSISPGPRRAKRVGASWSAGSRRVRRRAG
jgi:hypothetical protein